MRSPPPHSLVSVQANAWMNIHTYLVYANSFLATLNVRQSIKDQVDDCGPIYGLSRGGTIYEPKQQKPIAIQIDTITDAVKDKIPVRSVPFQSFNFFNFLLLLTYLFSQTLKSRPLPSQFALGHQRQIAATDVYDGVNQKTKRVAGLNR